MDLKLQFISNDETLRSKTIKDSEDSNSHSLYTQAQKREQLVAMMPSIKKAFNLLRDDLVELSTGNEALRKRIGS